MKKMFVFALFTGFLLIALGIINVIHPLNFDIFGDSSLKSFSSYAELKDFLNASTKWRGYHAYPNEWALTGTQGLAPLLSAESASPPASLPSYSRTNVQVEGVDEADIVKTDGLYIYVVSGTTVSILKAYPATEAEILAQIKLNGTAKGLFINNDRLVVFEELSPYTTYESYARSTSTVSTWQTFIRVYDVTDRANPVSARNVSLDGSYFNSRMIGSYVYAVVDQQAYEYVYSPNYKVNVTIPKVCVNDQAEELAPTQIYYSNVSDSFNTYTHVIAVNILNDIEQPTIKAFLLGPASTMYVSQTNLYITYSTMSRLAWGWNQYEVSQKTIIHRIQVQDGDIDYQATGEVPGYLLNQFSMDEYNGYFRIATTTGEVWATGESASENHVFILDMRLDTVGSLEGLAHGEKIHSARFMGDKGYLVTFKKIDPLFVLDLSDPTSPKSLGELKITGYSDYLHPYDETHIIGIGKETVEAQGGNFAWYQGIKISLFDVTDVENPTELAKHEIGDRGTDSPILSDHKAFLFDKSKNLLVIPVKVAEIGPSDYPNRTPPSNAYGEIVWNGAYVFTISLEEGLTVKGRITHANNDMQPVPYWYSTDNQYSIKRSLYIDDVLYTISDAKIKMNALSDLSEIMELSLNEWEA